MIPSDYLFFKVDFTHVPEQGHIDLVVKIELAIGEHYF